MINTNFNQMPSKTCFTEHSKRCNTAFTGKYPVKDVLCVMSGEITHNVNNADKLVEKLLNKKAETQMNKAINLFKAQNKLKEKYPNLAEAADRFQHRLHGIKQQHDFITPKDIQNVADIEAKKLGSSTIDIEI